MFSPPPLPTQPEPEHQTINSDLYRPSSESTQIETLERPIIESSTSESEEDELNRTIFEEQGPTDSENEEDTDKQRYPSVNIALKKILYFVSLTSN